MAEIRIALTKKLGLVVSLRAELAECSDAVRTLGLIVPGLKLARTLDRDVSGRSAHSATPDGAERVQ